jgi:hypothetical protein
VTFQERLRVPVSWWLLALLAVLALWLAYDVALGPAVAVPVTLLTLAGVAAGLVGYGSLTLRADSSGFSAGPAHLPAWAIGPVEVLERDEARSARGPQADPRSFFVLRGYVPGAVRVSVHDPSDPVPSWVVSTRRPHELARTLAAVAGVRPGDVEA